MDSDFSKKINAVIAEENGTMAMAILNMAAYFSPGEIRLELFSPIIQDRTVLKAAIEILQRHSLVKSGSKENSLFILDTTQARQRDHLKCEGMDVIIMKQTLSLLNGIEMLRQHHPHFLSVYKHAIKYPSLQKDMDTLPGKIVFSFCRCGKSEEAVEFGKACNEILTLDESHETVLHLRTALGLALMQCGKEEEAIKTVTNAYYVSYLAMDEHNIIATMFMLGKIIFKSEPIDQAENRLRKIVFFDREVSESDVAEFELSRWIIYARLLSKYDLTSKAISITESVIKERRRMFGPNYEGIVEAQILKAECLTLEERLEEAMEILLNIHKRTKKKLSLRKTMNIQINIGKILKKQGALEEAIFVFERIAKKIMLAGGNEEFLKTKMEIVEVYILQQDFEKALKLSTNLYEELVLAFGVTDQICFQCKMFKGKCLLKLNQRERSLEVFQDLLENCENYPEEVDLEELNSNISYIKSMDLFDASSGTFHALVKEDNTDEALSLIVKGEDIEAKDKKGMTPLQYAYAFGRVEVAKALIKRGAKYPSKLPSQFTPLEGSEMHKLLETVNSFFDFVKAGDNDKVKYVASKENCVLGARDSQGCTALHWAALHAHLDVLKGLLKLGCDPTMVSDKGNSPLHIAASKGHVGIAEAILRSMGPAKVAALLDGRTGSGGNTPLHAAAEKGHLGVVKALMAHGAIYCPVNAVGMTPMQLCKDSECRKVLMIVEKLFLGVTKGEVESVGRMLEELDKKDVLAVLGARNEENKTLIQVAMKHKHLELTKNIVKLLKHDLEL